MTEQELQSYQRGYRRGWSDGLAAAAEVLRQIISQREEEGEKWGLNGTTVSEMMSVDSGGLRREFPGGSTSI